MMGMIPLYLNEIPLFLNDYCVCPYYFVWIRVIISKHLVLRNLTLYI